MWCMLASLPSPRTPDPHSAPPLRWGILGTGGIAGRMVDALRYHTRQTVVAVGSRSHDRAQQFASDKGIPRSCDSYERLVADPNVDIIYVASPHSEHAAHALLALQAGKPVLVEKAFTRNWNEASQVVATAKEAQLLVMEAIMTRFTPAIDILRQLVENGDLGTIDMVIADHGQNLVHVPRLVQPELAGGALLDLGIYCVQLAVMVGGLPERVSAIGACTDTGVDAHVSISCDGFQKAPQMMAALQTTMLASTATTAVVTGSQARVQLSCPFTSGGLALRYIPRDGEVLESPMPAITGAQALCYEAAHFAQLVADGQTDSPIMPADESVAIMGLLDDVRSQVGVRYPGE